MRGLAILLLVMVMATVAAVYFLFKMLKNFRMDDDVEEMMLRNAARRVQDYLKDRPEEYVTEETIHALTQEVREREASLHQYGGTEASDTFEARLMEYILREHMLKGEVNDLGVAVYRLPDDMKQRIQDRKNRRRGR